MILVPATAEPLVAAHVPRDHPVVTRDYSLFTVAIHDMVERISTWLDDQIDGATIFGPSRFGKSSAVDHWLQRLLPERHGGHVPLIIWSHTDSGSAAAVGRFCAYLLEASGHRLAQSRRSPLERQTMLVERWIELAAQGGGRFLVLVIDEAQGMSQRERIWLVQLHRLQEKQRIRPVRVLDRFAAVLRRAPSAGRRSCSACSSASSTKSVPAELAPFSLRCVARTHR
ncbi:hypothetical protein J7I88_05475 [Paraburkholderia strydomiana]|nr:hypothetical protein [Paraburkholderia strydomiana]